jgi:hypothetical protein
MLGNLLLYYDFYFMQEDNEGNPISELETCADFVSSAVNQDSMAGYTSAIPLTSLTIKHVCLICK